MQFFYLLHLLFVCLSAQGLALNKMITKEGIMNQQASLVKLALEQNGETLFQI